jgi:hypothetical protein
VRGADIIMGANPLDAVLNGPNETQEFHGATTWTQSRWPRGPDFS